ncbi:MAG: hypothetical protein GF421_01250 [Candidatus Aminicenantes bacterium]|nr:hypothetical protein [Candidatus Aminicenantes bacterium]
MNYQQCLSYLDHIQALGIKFGLDNVRAVVEKLNNPHQDFPIIQVAGSNGKGSVCAMVTRILSLHQIKCGLFTSPHLVEAEERIRIGNELIPRDRFCRLLSLLKEVIQQLIKEKTLKTPPTYFELMTLLALLYFRKEQVDMAVLEVGMGGRFDATTVVNPDVTAITTISNEHQEYLGDSLSQIALEKAGIIKPGIPVVSGVENDEARKAIKQKAESLKAPFIEVFGKDSCFERTKTKNGYVLEYAFNGETYRYSPSLPGLHQGKNGATAIRIADQISRAGRKLEKETIIKGLETTEWEGRLEVVSRRPLIIMDGAHNMEGALALREYWSEFVGHLSVLIFAVMRDKQIKELSGVLFPLAEQIILTRFPFRRSASPEDVLAQSMAFKHKIICVSEPEQALQSALRSVEEKGSILIAGSLYIVGAMKKYLKARANQS